MKLEIEMLESRTAPAMITCCDDIVGVIWNDGVKDGLHCAIDRIPLAVAA